MAGDGIGQQPDYLLGYDSFSSDDNATSEGLFIRFTPGNYKAPLPPDPATTFGQSPTQTALSILGILHLFRKRKSRDKLPSLIYLLTRLIVSFRKAVHQAERAEVPRTMAHAISRAGETSVQYWRSFVSFVTNNLKSLKEEMGNSTGSYCEVQKIQEIRSLFQSEVVRNAFRHLLNVVFEDCSDIPTLETKLRIRVAPTTHPTGGWIQLRDWLYWQLFPWVETVK